MYNIGFLTTGGTIEKVYEENTGLLSNKVSMLADHILGTLRYPYHNFEIEQVMNKDSLNMDDRDRERIFKAVCEWQEKSKPLIVVHGTDTMELTARYLLKKGVRYRAPVVFTGAMRPLIMKQTDAFQNIIDSIQFLTLWMDGKIKENKEPIYISFHGRIYHGSEVTKDHEKATFKSL